MKTLLFALLCMPMLACAQRDPANTDAQLRKLAWQAGPSDGRIASKAIIKVPEGYVFLDEANTSKFLELTGNPPSDGYYTFAPKALNWFTVFSFDPTGYVKDDEKIDADQLLKTLKESDGPSNEERKRRGMDTLTTEGWEVPPHYDADTKQLEWGIRLKGGDGGTTVNYTSRILGRGGVMKATLVSDPASLSADMTSFKANMKDFNYLPGERYAEYTSGDKVAEYGLAALVVGGAAAAAAKTGLLGGLWKWLAAVIAGGWKIIAGLAVAAMAGLKKMFGKREE
jgi:uncharacterized membrane-anchored protein